jgi:hypothetical protein
MYKYSINTNNWKYTIRGTNPKAQRCSAVEYRSKHRSKHLDRILVCFCTCVVYNPYAGSCTDRRPVASTSRDEPTCLKDSLHNGHQCLPHRRQCLSSADEQTRPPPGFSPLEVHSVGSVMLEGENGCFLLAVWLNLPCIYLSLRSYGCDWP